MHRKSETYLKFIHFISIDKKFFNSHINILWSDGGGEYTSHQLQYFLFSHGITHQYSCPYTPEQNGVVERKHRHFIDTTRTLLHAKPFPFIFLVALNTAVYLIKILLQVQK